MWILDRLLGRGGLAAWQKLTDHRLRNQQGDLLRIEQKLDEADFRLHRTLGEISQRLDSLAIDLGALACDLTREKKHTNLIGQAGELTLSTIRTLRGRLDELDGKAAEADRQIAALCEWGAKLDAWVESRQGQPSKLTA